jgi:hypothetical protein
MLVYAELSGTGVVGGRAEDDQKDLLEPGGFEELAA